MAATALPPFDVAALPRFLPGASGAEKVEVAACELLAGGAIQENWGLDVFFSDGRLAGPQRLVLRTNAASGIPSSLARLDEFAVLQAAFAAGVTVPEPLFACADPGIVGKQFFVMRRGAPPPPSPPPPSTPPPAPPPPPPAAPAPPGPARGATR